MKLSAYLIQEPTTGLYAAFGAPTDEPPARLTYQRHATRFSTANAALLAAVDAGLNDQPHELVRVDA